MRATDIEFVMNSGEHVGERYSFTLADSNGQKAWQVTRLFRPPPAMAKEKIDMIIAVREKNIPTSAAMELKQAKDILSQLETIAKETTPVTLKGVDGDRLVRVDKSGFQLSPTIKEHKRETEYQVQLTCWSVFE